MNVTVFVNKVFTDVDEVILDQGGPESSDWYLYKRKRGRFGYRAADTQRRKTALWRQRQRLKGCSYKPRMIGTPRTWNEAGRTLPRSLRTERGPAHPLISDFWSPDCERIMSCCFRSPSLLSFVVAAPERTAMRGSEGLTSVSPSSFCAPPSGYWPRLLIK